MESQKELYAALLNRCVLRNKVTQIQIALCDSDNNIHQIDDETQKVLDIEIEFLYLKPSEWEIDSGSLYNKILSLEECTYLPFFDGKCEVFRTRDYFMLFGTWDEHKFIDCTTKYGIWGLIGQALYYIKSDF